MNTSIFRQLFFSYGALVLFLLITLFGASYIELSIYLNHRATKEILLTASIERNKLESELNQQFVNLKSWSHLDVMNDFITQDVDLRITQTLELLKKQYRLPGNLYALSMTGDLIAADHEVPDDSDFSYWQKAIEKQQVLIDKHLDPISQQAIIALWQPVYASFDASQVIGYLMMTYPWSEIEAMHELFDNYTHILLFNQQGYELIQDKHLTNVPTFDTLTQFVDQTWSMTFLSHQFYPDKKTLKAKQHEITLNGNTFFVYPLTNTSETPLTNLWYWFALADKTQFYTPMWHILRIALFLVMLVLALTLSIIFIISRKISHPIYQLTDMAVNIASTLDLSQRIPIEGKNEVARLATAFNEMCLTLNTAWQERQRATQSLLTLNQQLEQKVAERTEHLAWQATHDPLTGLPNRALLSERLTQSISRSRRDQSLLAVMFIDLDGFKAVNDTFGHDKGDYLLIDLAKRFSAVIREPDTIARLGGDEFVILMSLRTLDDLNSPLQRVISLINEPVDTGTEQLCVSSSIGITLYPDDLSDADTLIRHADQAMYDAKQKGRNRVQFFNVEMDEQIHTGHQQRERIQQAIQQQELVLHYQPQIDLMTGQVIGAEALIRWQHPEQGLIFPDNFLPIIEETDIIIDLGRWVIQQACKQLQYWDQHGLHFKLSVNIAGRHIQHPDFFTELLDILKASPEVSPEQLILEITESSAMNDIARAKTTLQNCHDANVRIALDDFGTGYSSLTYLRQLPVSFLKIDKSFVIDMLSDEDDKAIVEGIISLADIFKQNVVAEGIETQGHLAALKAMNCALGQGYAISKPLTSNDFDLWLESRAESDSIDN